MHRAIQTRLAMVYTPLTQTHSVLSVVPTAAAITEGQAVTLGTLGSLQVGQAIIPRGALFHSTARGQERFYSARQLKFSDHAQRPSVVGSLLDFSVMLLQGRSSMRTSALAHEGQESSEGQDSDNLDHFGIPYMGDWLRGAYSTDSARLFNTLFCNRLQFFKGYWKAAPRRAAPGLEGDNLFLVFANQLYRLAFGQDILVRLDNGAVELG